MTEALTQPVGSASEPARRSGSRSAAVVLSGQGAKFVVQMVSLILLARLLSPEEYGLVSIVLAVVTVALGISDFGFSLASIQKTDISQREKSNLFWINLAVGLLCSGGLIAIAAPLAQWMGTKQLFGIAIALSPIFLLSAATAQFRAELTRAGMYVRLGVVDVASQSIGLGVGVSVAVAGLGYWSLVAMQIAIALAALLFACIFARWTPSWPSRTSVRPLLHFGAATMATQTLNYVSTNSAVFFLGAFQPAYAAGYFSRGLQLFSMPLVQLAAPLTRVALPSLSRIDNEAAFRSYMSRSQMALGYLVLLPLGALAGGASLIVVGLLGDDWAPVVPVVQALSVGGVFQIMGYSYYWVFLARGRTTAMALSEGVGRLVMIVLIFIGATHGATGAAVGFAAGLFVTWASTTVGFAIARQPVGVAIRSSLRPLALSAFAAAQLALIVQLGLLSWAPTSFVGSVIAVVEYICVAALVAIAVPHVRRDFLTVYNSLRSRPA